MMFFSAGEGPVLIDRTAGTNIGSMTGGGGLAAAFNGNTNQSESGCAEQGTGSGWLGKTLAAAKKFGGATVYGSNDQGFVYGANGSVTLNIRGKNGTAPSSRTDGTVVGTLTFTDTSDESGGRTISSTNLTTSWDHLILEIVVASSFAVCAELVLYEWA